ncbi:NADPH:quinone oxidoreductase family protein [Henriciella mobilis]|nr:NADPH:quinone oxidoreductase family protein [Henriciella mobilis]
MMKALLSLQAGPPETLQLLEADTPSPGTNEVRLRVHACALNYTDLLLIEDKYQYRPARPFSPGSEVAGIIDAVGEGVDKWKPGDRVIAYMYHGGLAETAIVSEASIATLPADRSFIDGASFLIPYGTAYHALTDRGCLRPDETLLVLGATSNVGLAAVQLGKAIGAKVLAATSSQQSVDILEDAGADDVLVYDRPPLNPEACKALSANFKALTGRLGADVILDTVGGPYTDAAIRAIGWDGRFLVVGFTAGIPSLPLNLLLMKRCQAIGVFWGPYMERSPERYSELVQNLFELWDSGQIHPRRSRIFPLDQSREALETLRAGGNTGRLVINVSK